MTGTLSHGSVGRSLTCSVGALVRHLSDAARQRWPQRAKNPALPPPCSSQSGGGGFPVAPEPTDSFILNAADTDEVLWPIPAAPDSAVTSVAAPGGEMTEEEFSSFLAFLEALPPYGDCAAGELGSDAMDIGGVLWPTPAAPDSAVTSVAAPGGYCLSEMTNPWQSLGVCVGGDLSGQDGDEEFIPLLDEFLGYL